MENAATPPADRSASAARSAANGTRVGTGKRMFLGVDSRTLVGRRLRELIERFATPWGGLSGADEPTRQLIRRGATMALQAEMLDADMASGRPVDPTVYATLTNSLSRCLAKLERLRPAPRKPTRVDPFATDRSRTIHDIMAEEAAGE